jgi:hypothetical protein
MVQSNVRSHPSRPARAKNEAPERGRIACKSPIPSTAQMSYFALSAPACFFASSL